MYFKINNVKKNNTVSHILSSLSLYIFYFHYMIFIPNISIHKTKMSSKQLEYITQEKKKYINSAKKHICPVDNVQSHKRQNNNSRTKVNSSLKSK